jgi:outer membrane protein OmpA-like peptidoglycan-associated protein
VVLGDDADHTVLAHELVHVLQQRGAGRNAVQRQEKPSTGGIGTAPPKVRYDVVRDPAPTEDARVYFAHDSVTPTGLDPAALLPKLATSRPLVVDIDGYASTEGDSAYNTNLSAHRAAVLRALLLPLLPDGSEVLLHAHGATTGFGDPAANRRVGIRIREAPVQLVPPLSAPPLRRDRPQLLPDLHLRLDPMFTPLPPGLQPPGTLPPIPDVRLRDPATGEPYRSDDPARTPEPGPVGPPHIPDLPPPGPERPPQLFPWLVPPKRSVVNWGDVGQVLVDHGAGPMDQKLAKAAEEFADLWYQRYRAAGLSDDRAHQLANLGLKLLIGNELAKEGNTPADRIDNELRRQGLPTPIGGSVDLLDLLRRVRKERGDKR